MEKEKWSLEELEQFATAFLKVSSLWSLPWFHKGNLELGGKHATPLMRLATLLKQPRDAKLVERQIIDFLGNLLLLMRWQVRLSRDTGASLVCMVEKLPSAVRRVVRLLDIDDIAYLLETGEFRVDAKLHSRKVKNFAKKLVQEVQAAVARRMRRVPGTGGEMALFIRSVAAVRRFATELGASPELVLRLWLKMYTETLRRVCVRDEPSLCVLEWRLADLALLYEPNVVLVSGSPERSMEYLFCLIAAAAARIKRPAGAQDLVFGSRAPEAEAPADDEARLALKYAQWVRSVWTAVNIAYCKSGRVVSSVLLQRRWHQLRCAAAKGEAAFGLLQALGERFPEAVPPWEELVRRGLVVDLTSLGCTEPELLCLLDDIEEKNTPEFDSIDNLPYGGSDRLLQRLHAIDPSAAQVSIVIETEEEAKPEDKPQSAPEPPAAEAHKPEVPPEDSLGFIIKQALNCRSIVRLESPRLRMLTDDILQSNSRLADCDSGDEDRLVIDDQVTPASRVKRERSDSPEAGRDRGEGKKARLKDTEGVQLELGDRVPEKAFIQKLAMETRVELRRVDEAPLWRAHARDASLDLNRVSADELAHALPAPVAQLARRHGLPPLPPAWWARNLPLASRCRPLCVRLHRPSSTPRAPPPPTLAPASTPTPPPDPPRLVDLLQRDSRLRWPFPPPGPVAPDATEQKPGPLRESGFDYLYADMVEILAHNAKKFLPNHTIPFKKKTKTLAAPATEEPPNPLPQDELAEWERQKSAGLEYFRMPHLRRLPAPEAAATESMDSNEKSPSNEYIVLDSDEEASDGAREEALGGARGTASALMDEEISGLMRSEGNELALSFARIAKAAGRETITVQSLIDKMACREAPPGESEEPAPQWPTGSSRLRLPHDRTISVDRYLQLDGRSAAALLRMDSALPLWLLPQGRVLLTFAQLPTTRPTYWTTLHSSTCSRLTRVLFDRESADSSPTRAEDELTLLWEPPADTALPRCARAAFTRVELPTTRKMKPPAATPFLYKRLCSIPPAYSVVYSVVQSVKALQELVKSRSPLCLYSLADGSIGNVVVMLDNVAAPGGSSLVTVVPAPEDTEAPAASAKSELCVSLPAYETPHGNPRVRIPPPVLRAQQDGLLLTQSDIDALLRNSKLHSTKLTSDNAKQLLQNGSPPPQ